MSRKTGGLRASGRVNLPMWTESGTALCYGAWPLDEVVTIMHKPLRKRSLYVFLCFGIIYLRLGWVSITCIHALTALITCADMNIKLTATLCHFIVKHRLPSDLRLRNDVKTFIAGVFKHGVKLYIPTVAPEQSVVRKSCRSGLMPTDNRFVFAVRELLSLPHETPAPLSHKIIWAAVSARDPAHPCIPSLIAAALSCISTFHCPDEVFTCFAIPHLDA